MQDPSAAEDNNCLFAAAGEMTIVPHDMYTSCGNLLRAWQERPSFVWQMAFATARTFIIQVTAKTRPQQQPPPPQQQPIRTSEASRRAVEWFVTAIGDSWVENVLAAFSLLVATVALARVFRTPDNPQPFFGWCPTCLAAADSAPQTEAQRILAQMGLRPFTAGMHKAQVGLFDAVQCPCSNDSQTTGGGGSGARILGIFSFITEDEISLADKALRTVWQTCITGDFYLPLLRRLVLACPDDSTVDGSDSGSLPSAPDKVVEAPPAATDAAAVEELKTVLTTLAQNRKRVTAVVPEKPLSPVAAPPPPTIVVSKVEEQQHWLAGGEDESAELSMARFMDDSRIAELRGNPTGDNALADASYPPAIIAPPAKKKRRHHTKGKHAAVPPLSEATTV